MKNAKSCVRWRFRIVWVRAGEGKESRMESELEDDISRPWWTPPSDSTLEGATYHSSARPNLKTPPLQTQVSSLAPPNTPALYRQLRHERRITEEDMARGFFSVIPEVLLAPFNAFLSNEAFPTGWWCRRCGMVNFQRAMRHRECGSAKCLRVSCAVHLRLWWILMCFAGRKEGGRCGMCRGWRTSGVRIAGRWCQCRSVSLVNWGWWGG